MIGASDEPGDPRAFSSLDLVQWNQLVGSYLVYQRSMLGRLGFR